MPTLGQSCKISVTKTFDGVYAYTIAPGAPNTPCPPWTPENEAAATNDAINNFQRFGGAYCQQPQGVCQQEAGGPQLSCKPQTGPLTEVGRASSFTAVVDIPNPNPPPAPRIIPVNMCLVKVTYTATITCICSN